MLDDVYFRKTRKVYFWFYLIIFIMIVFYIYVWLQGDVIERSVVIAALIFIVLGIKYIEADRLYNLYGFNSQYLFHKSGILKKRVKKVFLGRISDIVLCSGIINRIFNYGDVNVHHFGGSGVVSVKKISNPQKFINELQEKIKGSSA